MADELIKRSEVIKEIEFGITHLTIFNRETGELSRPFEVANTELLEAISRIKQLTPVDAVPVVRCNTCRYYDERNDPSGETSGSYPYCHQFCDYIDADGYCKWGKCKDRKDEA